MSSAVRLPESTLNTVKKSPETVARYSLIAVVGMAAITILVAFLAGVRGNDSLILWLGAILLIPLTFLPYLAFALTIARYRRNPSATLFCVVCCGVLTVGSFLVFTEAKSGAEPSVAAYLLLAIGTSLASLGCMLLLRVAEFLRKLFTSSEGTSLSLRKPNSRRLIAVLSLLWSGLFWCIALVIHSRSSNALEQVRDIFLQNLLVRMFGAVASQMWSILLPAVGCLLLFTAAILVPSWRSPQLARRCVFVYLALSLFTLFPESWVLLFYSWMFESYGTTFTEAVSLVGLEMAKKAAIPYLDVVVAALWFAGVRLVLSAIKKDASTVGDSVEVKAVPHRKRDGPPPLPGRQRLVAMAKYGGASLAVNLLVCALLIIPTLLLSQPFLSSPEQFDGMKALLGLWIFGAHPLIFPAFGIVAVTTFLMNGATRDRLLSWESLELGFGIWQSHLMVSIPVSLPLGLIVFNLVSMMR